MPICRRFLISGSVQGVFYRASARDVARRLGLTGWVRNLDDGRVELIACGTTAGLQELEQWLWQGPPHARVAQVQVGDAGAQSFTGFTIAH